MLNISYIFCLEQLMKEGGQTLDHLFETMCLLLGKYLQEIGLVPKHISDVVGLTRVIIITFVHNICMYMT